ncbi:MAG: hypothetical protein Q9183_003096, partial [Haloplaca sp. 2 TL-2023]
MAPPKALPQAHHHPSPLTTLIPHLVSLLPNSLPLLRRIQFQPASPHAHCFATFQPSTQPLQDLKFAALWVDRTRAPETECWIFSTYELDPRHQEDSHECDQDGEVRDSEKEEGPGIKYHPLLTTTPSAQEARNHVLALLNAVATSPHTSSLPQKQKGNEAQVENDFLVIGSLHDSLLPLLTSPSDILPLQRVLSRTNPGTASEIGGGEGVLAGVGEATVKFLIPTPRSRSSPLVSVLLPDGYTISMLHSQEMEICIARTEIPRT